MKTLIEGRRLKDEDTKTTFRSRIMKIQVTKTLPRRRTEHKDTLEMQKRKLWVRPS